MKQKYAFVAAMLLFLAAASVVLTNSYVRYERNGAGSDFTVVTSFYPMYIAAKNIIGDCEGVTLESLSGPQTGCMHDYQLTTEDMRMLSAADVFIVNGGGIENFLADTAKQYPHLTLVASCEQVQLLENNAHAWMSVADYMIQVRTIADALAALDTDHKASYRKHATEYLSKLEELYQEQQELVKQYESYPNVLIFHEALEYTARDYGMRVRGGIDLDEERQVSAKETADVLRQIRGQQADMILAEELYGRRMCETIQKEAEVEVVYLDTCVRGDGDADSYLKAMRGNLAKMEQALSHISGQDTALLFAQHPDNDRFRTD